jgi:RecJ-like exonuclease
MKKKILCYNCAGTGEGLVEGARCLMCNGKGYLLHKEEPDEDFYVDYPLDGNFN